MKILGIDTSCDDTCISILKVRSSKFEVRSNVVSSQVKLHAKYGGVYPFLAKREHQKNLPIVFEKALRLASFAQGKPDLIGVTIGPGLEPCLWQGINFAKDLAKKLKKPLVPVNHIEAHILANFIRENSKFKSQNSKFCFPAICLVVSGGHTQLILMRNIGEYRLIGETRDDAAGECLDKVARILGLGYPGGPIVAKMATKIKNQKSRLRQGFGGQAKIKNIALPRPMMKQKNYDFSFSGLKTAVLYLYQKSKIKNQKLKQAICHEVQQAVIDVLVHKTLKAAKDFRVKSIILGGGVAANNELRRQFKLKIKNSKFKINFFIPEKIYCTDNAAMVATTAYFHRFDSKKRKWQDIAADANLRI